MSITKKPYQAIVMSNFFTPSPPGAQYQVMGLGLNVRDGTLKVTVCMDSNSGFLDDADEIGTGADPFSGMDAPHTPLVTQTRLQDERFSGSGPAGFLFGSTRGDAFAIAAVLSQPDDVQGVQPRINSIALHYQAIPGGVTGGRLPLGRKPYTLRVTEDGSLRVTEDGTDRVTQR